MLGWPDELLGQVIGGVAGLFVGGPFGAVMGAALGHAADQGAFPKMSFGSGVNPARLASMLGGREQLFSIGVVVLAAKLAKCDGPVVRQEIDAFKQYFRIPPTATRDIGRLFDQARDSRESFEPYARQLGDAFVDTPGVLEDVLAALFAIARADKPVNNREMDYLARVHAAFLLGQGAWDRARGGGNGSAPRSQRARRMMPIPCWRAAQREQRPGAAGLARSGAGEPPGRPRRARRAGGVRRQRHQEGRRHQRGLDAIKRERGL